MLRRIALCSLLLASTGLWAEEDPEIDCEQAYTTLDMNHCAKLEWDKVEVRLNEAYKNLMGTAAEQGTDDAKIQAKIRQAQRAWITFREADCDAQYEIHSSGTIRTLVYVSCMRERAEQRMKELENYAPY